MDVAQEPQKIGFGELRARLGRSFCRDGKPYPRTPLERILRDWSANLPTPELVGGRRIWDADAVEVIASIIRKDAERLP